MANQYSKSAPIAHRHIAQNLHTCMRLLEKFGASLNWKKMADIREAGDDCLKAALSNQGRGASYSDYREAADNAQTLMSEVWGAMLQDSSLDTVAPWVNTLAQWGKLIEDDPDNARDEAGFFVIPAVEPRLLNMRERLAGADEGNMTPLERLNHDCLASTILSDRSP